MYNPTKAPTDSPSQNPQLIQPKMKRTNTQKRPIDMDAISSRLNHNNTKQTNVRPNTTKIAIKSPNDSNDIMVSRNQQKRTAANIKISKQRRKRTSSSKSSKIEGKINEDDMLPLAKDLTEEELSRYQLNKT